VLAVLRRPAFRGLMGGSTVYFIGSAMQTTAASWLMVELTGSSFLAALVQTAVFLPMFLLALPAGVLGDITDRGRLIFRTMIVNAAAAALLTGLVIGGWVGPAVLLVSVFVCGCCNALMSPSWNSAVADAVPREDLPQAISVISISYNTARALGPALAGAVFALGGAGWNFAAGCLAAVALAWTMTHWPPPPHPPSRLPAERLWGGMLSGLRFAWHSQAVFAQFVRVMAYTGAGSALWALLPVVAQRQLGLGAAGFGLLMGCMGGGAVVAGFLIGRLRQRHGVERIVAAGCVVFALAMLVCAWSPWAAPVYLWLLLGGGAWMAATSTFGTATQTSVPLWVRSRALAMHTLASLGAFAFGSALWGAFADLAGLGAALTLAALLMLVGPFLAPRFPLRMGAYTDVTLAVPRDDLFVAYEPGLEEGPVAVEIGYRIREEDAQDFLDEIGKLRAPRQRDGATFWRVYRDLSDPTRFVERFIVASWADYLHQRARATLTDEAVEARVRAYVPAGVEITVSHYIAER
jgi:MFS family permease